MPLFYITGIPGSGKSTVCKELLKRGYEAHDADDGFAAFYNNESGKKVANPLTAKDRTPEWRAHHSWKIPRKRIGDLAAGSNDKPVFLCGTASNDGELWDLFSGVFALIVDSDTLKRQLVKREGSAFGKVPHELEIAMKMQLTAEEDYSRLGAVIVNAAQPVEVVADKILDDIQK